jgi:glycolate oxidase FAD binding subunit
VGVKARSQPLPGHQITVDEQHRLEVDGLLPAKVIRPLDAEDAARALRLCDRSEASVLVFGGATQMRLGSPPRRYDLALCTERMTQLLEYEPADLTCRVQAGMTLAELQRTLREQGQRLPLDPPRPERATVGGMVAANTSGLSRARYGTVRDWVIGIAVAYPSGKVARAGGKVVKNVAGYDLMKLHTGALGTLGVVAEVNLKIQALPEATATVLGHFEAAVSAIEAGARLARGYLAPAASIVVNRGALWACGLTADWNWTLGLKLEGYRREVDAARELAAKEIQAAGGRTEAQEGVDSFWAKARDWSAPSDNVAVLRAILPITATSAISAAMAGDAQAMIQPAAGIVEVLLSSSAALAGLKRLRAAAPPESQVLVASAPGDLKRSLDVWGPPPPGFALMGALKQSLDPNGILNPGRFVGGI